MTSLPLSLPSLALTLVFVACILVDLRRRRRQRLPPGPRPLPIIGNVHQMPKEMPWVVFSSWAKTYGDLMYMDFMGQPAIIVSDRTAAIELMEKRSMNYSDRPVLEMAKLAGFHQTMALEHYNDNWKIQRRLISPDYSPVKVRKYWPLQEKVTRLFVRNIIEDVSALRDNLRLQLGVIILRVTYGYSPQTPEDKFLVGGFTALDNFAKVATPGMWLVDVLPILKYLPSWLPGTSFLKTAQDWGKHLEDTVRSPYNWAIENIPTGLSLQPNLVSDVINRHNGKPLNGADENALVWAAGTMLGGALETNISVTLTFLMYMILNPEVQRKGQAELDSVVGHDRLPSISDRADLPYIRGIITETLRRGPPVPLCTPHAAHEDDVYRGYAIPKGAWIMANIWHMYNDPEQFPDPEVFSPERYNGDDVEMEKVKGLAFGFGRRTCPGKHFTEALFYSIVATILATCDVLPGLDVNGKEVLPKVEYEAGSITQPKPFPLRIKPRSPQAAALLTDVSPAIE
ncbi:cytochrome P450 [Crepidotus variabilis]|uniref:Cytochrome P450 n=1 Tax=Crepidotus variabilis TaxID=179855 RepID=A0A9P6ED48_9AGAR|nr:cytochrome P450 [Crepidotus variabilis]